MGEQPAIRRTRWSLWKAGSIGLLVSAAVLLLEVGGGDGFELADDAHTASAATIGNLAGRVLSVPFLFVLIAVVRNLFNRRKPASEVSSVRGALTFGVLLVLIFGALTIYGEVFFSRAEIIGGEARKAFIADSQQACMRKQHSVSQSISDAQIERYCTCTSEHVAEKTTYRQLGAEPDAGMLAELRQNVEAAANACR